MTVTVSNGQEFYRIESTDLPRAEHDGFYRPMQRGLTIVGNQNHLFEIPLSDLDAAKADGYLDLLECERQPRQQPTSSSLPRLRKVAPGAAVVENAPRDEGELLVHGLTQAEQEAEQARLEAEQKLAETEGWRWYVLATQMWIAERNEMLRRHFRGSGISIAIHVAIFLLLASLVLVNEKDPDEVVLMASPVTNEVVQEIIIEPEPLEITEPTETEQTESPPEAAEVEMVAQPVMPNFMAAVSGDAVKPPAMPSKDPGEGKEMPSKKSAVFGTKRSATNYVFVIDNSNSMGGGRFETAINELMIAVDGLTPKQKFYVIFYSDTAYPMMHPRPVTQLVAATTRNKQQLYYWLQSIQLCLKTNGKEAIQAAFEMQPDVIYILGDGAFTDGASKHFSQMSRTKTVVHTRGMQVKEKDAKEFERLAKAHGGNYKDVGVTQVGLQMFKAGPRPRNNSRGQVWGIKLPIKKK